MLEMKNVLYIFVMLCLFVSDGFIASSAAATLDYDEVIKKALSNTHDIKMSELDIEISRASLKSANSLYYPTVSGRWNTEYAKDLSDSKSQLNVIGNTILVQNTSYSSSFSLIGNYNLFDFGATENKISIARKDVDVKRSVYKQSVRDIKLKVLNNYSELLTSYEELETKKELLPVYKELSLTKERLYEAGKISKIDMVDEAIKTVQIMDDVDNLKLKVRALLDDLSFFTGDQYDSDATQINGFNETGDVFKSSFDLERTPESRMYDLEIEKKKAEIESIKRGLLPQFGIYSSYVWYRNNPDKVLYSARHIKPTNFIVGLSITIPLFEGFKSPAEIEKAKLELERLTIEKSEKLTELSTRHAKLSETYITAVKGVKNQKEILDSVEKNLAMSKRLDEQRTIERTEFLTREIELISQKLELTKTIITKMTNLKESKILSETGD
jgi:outer membrane protein